MKEKSIIKKIKHSLEESITLLIDSRLLKGIEEKKKEYLECESLMNSFFKEVDYCKQERCSNLYSLFNQDTFNGCCASNYGTQIDEGILDERIKLYGKGKIAMDHFCNYHSDDGCSLKSHKPAICNYYICNKYQDHLSQNYGLDYNSFNANYVLKNLTTSSNEKLTIGEVKEFKKKINEAIEIVREKNKK